MKNEATKAEVTPIKPVRKKSPETALKQEMAAINRDLAKVEKVITSFADVKKEFDGAEAKKIELTTKLDAVKVKLRTALGLD